MDGTVRPEAGTGESMRGRDIGGVADVTRRGTKAPVEGKADVVRRHIDRGERAIEQDEARTGREGADHGAIRAGLRAQQIRQLIGCRADQLGCFELQHFPCAIGVADGGSVGAAEQGKVRHGFQLPEVELDARAGGAIDAAFGPGGQRIERDACGDSRSDCRTQREARGLRRAQEGHNAGPGMLRRCDVATVRRFRAGEKRQVEKETERLARQCVGRRRVRRVIGRRRHRRRDRYCGPRYRGRH
ncbi:MAG: hypothetical protein HC869_24840, partial [Rhodospirillales bacterium]|nr:hypothetical protein [Rhodospirillales bacterium]